MSGSLPSNEKSAICFENVYKTFNGQDFIHQGIDLEIPKGAITALIGFSGTGKSVLLKMIMGLEKVSSGKVSVLGHCMNDITEDSLFELRRKYGVLFQNAALFDDHTTLENVLFPLKEHRRELSKSEMHKIASAKLKLVGLEDIHYNKLPNELSGGMRKRVGLARAIALDPDLILYDEPTTGLDPILTEMVDELILKTHKHLEGRTSIFVSHDLSAAFRIADYVAMLDSGKILLFGTPEDFLNSDIDLVKRFVTKGVKRR